ERLFQGKGVGEAVVERCEPRGGIKVERRPDRGGDLLDRHVFGMQLAAAIGEELIHSDRSWGRCSGRRTAAEAPPSYRIPRARGRSPAPPGRVKGRSAQVLPA